MPTEQKGTQTNTAGQTEVPENPESAGLSSGRHIYNVIKIMLKRGSIYMMNDAK